MRTYKNISGVRGSASFVMSTIVIGLLSSVTSPSLAHVPYIEGRDFEEGDVFEVPGPLEKSIAMMAQFHDAYDVDVVTFELSPEDLAILEDGVYGTYVHIGTMVPACSPYADVLPSVALVGPEQDSLPFPSDYDDFPFDMDINEGVTVVENDEQGEEYYEPFTMKTYYRQNTAKVFLTEPGTYWIYYWEPSGAVADYVMEVGDVEIWGFKEIIQALRNEWILIHDREIHNRKCRWEL